MYTVSNHTTPTTIAMHYRRACLLACLRACVLACVRACLRACLCAGSRFVVCRGALRVVEEDMRLGLVDNDTLLEHE